MPLRWIADGFSKKTIMEKMTENKTFSLCKLKCKICGVSVEYRVETSEHGETETLKNKVELPFCFPFEVSKTLEQIKVRYIDRTLLTDWLKIDTEDLRFYDHFELSELTLLKDGFVIKFAYLSCNGPIKMQSGKIDRAGYESYFGELETAVYNFLTEENKAKLDVLL